MNIEKEEPKQMIPENKNYKLPSLSILNASKKSKTETDKAAIEKNINIPRHRLIP